MEIAELLLVNGANVNAAGNQGDTPLWWAATLGRERMVELLLTNKADVTAKNNTGDTALHAVANKLDFFSEEVTTWLRRWLSEQQGAVADWNVDDVL